GGRWQPGRCGSGLASLRRSDTRGTFGTTPGERVIRGWSRSAVGVSARRDPMRSIGRIVAVTAMLTAVLFASPSTTPASGQQNSVSGTIQDGDMALDFTLNGGSITSAVPDGHYYTIEGTVRPGETISIAATARSIARDPASPNEPQAASFDIIVDGSDVHEHETLPPGEGGSLATSYIVPDDEWKV